MKFHGEGQLFIKTINDCTIQNKNYNAGELLLYFHNAKLAIGENAHNATNYTKNNGVNLTHRTGNATSASISVEGFKTDMLKVFAEERAGSKTFIPALFVEYSNSNGEIYLTTDADSKILKVAELSDKDTPVEHTYNADHRLIKGLTPDVEYLVCYEEERDTGSKYKLNTESTPWLELIFKPEGDNQVISIPKVSLHIEPQLIFSAGTGSTFTITAMIINGDVEFFDVV